MSTDYQSESESIPGYGPVKMLRSTDIFVPGNPPTIAAAQSKGGKTVMCVDIAYTASPHATGITFITNSYDTPANAYLRQMIPEIVVKQWSIELVCALWADILSRSIAITRSLRPQSIDRFLMIHVRESVELDAKLRLIDQVVEQNRGYFPNESELRAAVEAQKRGVKIAYIRDHFRPNHPNLSEEDRAVVIAARSSQPTHVIIFDDITPQLRSPPPTTAVYNIPSISESGELIWTTLKGKAAFEFLLISILTLGRHYAIIGFFVHTFDVFPPTVRAQFGATVFLSEDAVQQACRQRVLSSYDQELVVAAWAISSKHSHHKVVLFPNPDATTHGERIAIYKSQYHAVAAPIGVPTYRDAIANIQLAVNVYLRGSVDRAMVEQTKHRMQSEADALAVSGASMGTQPMETHPMGGMPSMLPAITEVGASITPSTLDAFLQ